MIARRDRGSVCGKAKAVRTESIEEPACERVDRRADDLDRTISGFHQRLADAGALLKLEVEELWNKVQGDHSPKHFDKLSGLIREANGVLGQINKIEAEVGLRQLDEKNALNLEDARAEILCRLARIAADQEAGSVPG